MSVYAIIPLENIMRLVLLLSLFLSYGNQNSESHFFRITELKGIRLRIQTKCILGPEYMIYSLLCIAFKRFYVIITGKISNADSPGNLEMKSTTEIS